jgi:hypothetical protein
LNAAASDETPFAACRTAFPVRDYDLAATLTSGQVFRWELRDRCWEGVIGRRWVRLSVAGGSITAETAEAAGEAAVSNATPLSNNGYKVQLAKVAVKRAILRAAGLETGGF